MRLFMNIHDTSKLLNNRLFGITGHSDADDLSSSSVCISPTKTMIHTQREDRPLNILDIAFR